MLTWSKTSGDLGISHYYSYKIPQGCPLYSRCNPSIPLETLKEASFLRNSYLADCCPAPRRRCAQEIPAWYHCCNTPTPPSMLGTMGVFGRLGFWVCWGGLRLFPLRSTMICFFHNCEGRCHRYLAGRLRYLHSSLRQVASAKNVMAIRPCPRIHVLKACDGLTYSGLLNVDIIYLGISPDVMAALTMYQASTSVSA